MVTFKLEMKAIRKEFNLYCFLGSKINTIKKKIQVDISNRSKYSCNEWETDL